MNSITLTKRNRTKIILTNVKVTLIRVKAAGIKTIKTELNNAKVNVSKIQGIILKPDLLLDT